MALAEPIQVTLLVGKILDDFGVSWIVGGSLASSAHGIPRATAAVDLVANLRPSHVDPLVKAVEATFYASRSAIEAAVAHRSSFNLIHLTTMIKVDIFVPGTDPLAQAQIERRVTLLLDETGHVALPVAAPEDIILQKLRWFDRGGRSPQRQWDDVQGVLEVRGEDLDLDYLRSQAGGAGLSELLVRALREAGLT